MVSINSFLDTFFVNNKNIKRLLDFVFTLQSPVAPVYLWHTNEDHNKEYLINILNSINRVNLKDNMIYIKENSSLIPFL